MWRRFGFGALLLFLLLGNASSAHALPWEEVSVRKVLDNSHFQLSDDRVVRQVGIVPPDLLAPTLAERPLCRKTFRLLKILLVGESVKILPEESFENSPGPLPVHLKLSEGEYLAEVLLREGLTLLERKDPDIRFFSTYEKAEKEARENFRGRWGDTDVQKARRKIRAQASRASQEFRKKYAPFFAPIAVGKVQRVLSGDLVELENGLQIRLLGIQTPPPGNNPSGLDCFGTAAQKHLSSLLEEKTVWLQKDVSDFGERRELLRYVFLPEERVSVNEQMIRDGFARSFWITDDHRLKEVFEDAQLRAYQEAAGAWQSCVGALLFSEKNKGISRPIDRDCPVKGNISRGKKTFHTSASGWYQRLQPERCFATEAEALDAGFEKVK